MCNTKVCSKPHVLLFTSQGRAEQLTHALCVLLAGDAAFAQILECDEGLAMSSKEVALEQ